MTAGLAARCPSCGGPVRFGGAASVVAVCSYCRGTVARRGVEVELLGQVPDLVATDRRLSLGRSGAVDGKSFVLIGHVQLAQEEAGATRAAWDEWYAAFSDGSWGWIAEAQGRLYFTQPVPVSRGAPAFSSLSPGAAVALPGVGQLVVEELTTARFITAEGELPFAPALGDVYAYADCTGEAVEFVTLDYGTGDGDPEVFAGRALSYAEIGAADVAPSATSGATVDADADEGEALACPNCGGPLSLRLPDTASLTCPSCRGLLDVQDRGVRLIARLHGRTVPAIPLGTKSKLGEPLEVIGWVRRGTTVDGVDYTWDEYLLHGKAGYEWLVESSGHFVLAQSIPAGRVRLAGDFPFVDGVIYRPFQAGVARYLEMQGEFYWRIRAGAEVATADFVAPPLLLSSERTDREINWSRGTHLTGDEVWKRFGLPGAPPAAVGVAPAQPNPWAAIRRTAGRTAAIATAALLVVAAGLAARVPGNVVLALDAPTQGESSVTLSEPFELTGGTMPVEIHAAATLDQAWVGVDVALIHDESGETDAVGFELSHYSGYDDGESWSEGSTTGSAKIGRVRDGRYVLRVEPQIEKGGTGAIPDAVHVEVVRGAFMWSPLALALLALFAWPAVAWYRFGQFEKTRWADSDFGGSSSGGSGDSDEGDDA